MKWLIGGAALLGLVAVMAIALVVAVVVLNSGGRSSLPIALRMQFPGFSLEAPPGWKRIVPNSERTLAELHLDVGRLSNKRGMFVVDIAPNPKMDLLALAHKYASETGARVDGAPIFLDGIPGIRVTIDNRREQSDPRQEAFVLYNNSLYSLTTYSTDSVDTSGVFESICASWKWHY